MNRQVRIDFSLSLVRSGFRATQSDRDVIYVDRDALDISQNQIAIRRPILRRSNLLIGARSVSNCPGDKRLDIRRRDPSCCSGEGSWI